MYCKTCMQDKEASAFYVSNQTRCKECVKASVAAYRQENLEKIRAYDRMRASQPHRIANNYAQSSSWRKEFPNRMLAHSRVSHALAKGTLKKQPCWVCGEKAVAHHPDYDRPLDVVWLCQAHHKQAHALVANDSDFAPMAPGRAFLAM